MNHVTASPDRWPKVYVAVSGWLVGVLACAGITLGLLWAGLHFVIVPRVAEVRPWLEQRASAALGLTVRIGAVQARSNGLIPSVELLQVRVHDAQGREALVLPTVLAAFSPRSVLGLGFEQLVIEAPQLDVRRSKDGRLWIAGIAWPDTPGTGFAAADWLFSQTELAVRHGTLRWTDETRDAPALELRQVDLVLRNQGRSHALRVDATPPAAWGPRVQLMGRFTHPFLAAHAGDWKAWSGQLYAHAQALDLARLRDYADLGLVLHQGGGRVTAWVDVVRAQVSSATVDLDLPHLRASVDPAGEPLDLLGVRGRLGYVQRSDAAEFQSQGLAFETQDGIRWPAGNVRLVLSAAKPTSGTPAPNRPTGGALTADRLDLAGLAELAERWPLDAALRTRLRALRPQGTVHALQVDWHGELQAPDQYSAKGRIEGLHLAASPKGSHGIPGVRGADMDFAFGPHGGVATLAMQGGSLTLPDIFDAPVLGLDRLEAQVHWKRVGPQWAVDIRNLQFANADVQGKAQLAWQGAMGQTPSAPGRGAFGLLDLRGSLERLDLAALHRYLPTAMHKPGRDYLQAALAAGQARDVDFKVKGDLAKFPFADRRQGEFRIAGRFENALYAYVPAAHAPGELPPWPRLTQASGDLVLEHDNLQISGGKAGVEGSPGVQFVKVDATIGKLYDASVVEVAAQAKGPLQEVVGMVNRSPLGVWTHKSLARTTASGAADYKFKLQVPLHATEQSTVEGSIALAGNGLQISPELPALSAVFGQIAFTETGFSVPAAQARALGGEVRIDGGLQLAGGDAQTSTPFALAAAAANRPPANVLRLQGTVSAEGLRQSPELGAVTARLGQFASGATSYSATIRMEHGTPELLVTSALSGMALQLPAPFSKPAHTRMPVRFASALVPGSWQPGARLQDRISLEVGDFATVVYERDIAGTQSQVLRGTLGVGLLADESAPLPDAGVAANVQLDTLDVDAWVRVLSGTDAGFGQIPAMALQYVPTQVAVRTQALQVQGRQLKHVVVGGAREGLVWRANVVADELNGYVQYQQPGAATQGKVFARLAHLNLGPSVAQDVEALLDQQPSSIPALDIVVDDFVLKGKKLGHLAIEAINLAATPAVAGVLKPDSRAWRLNRLELRMPEASLKASGTWADVAATAPRAALQRRSTVLDFVLDVADSGRLLERLGMPGVIAKGKGKLDGQVQWLGSPLALDYASLTGAMQLNMAEGQFLKADPGLAKLLGVLSLQSLPRRLTLDFRDVFSDGFAFDSVQGDIAIAQGIARTSNLAMRGVSAVVLMEGQADLAQETQRINVVVIPEINAGSASVLASIVNPVVAVGTFLAQAILRGPLINANTQQFFIDGTWLDPRITKVARP